MRSQLSSWVLVAAVLGAAAAHAQQGPPQGPDLVAKTDPRGAAPAKDAAAVERFAVELRIIEGTPGTGGEQQVVDGKLQAFAKDLRALPFKQLKLVDSHTTSIKDGERVSLEIPAAESKDGKKAKKRFLQVAAHGRQAGGKLRFQLSIEALKFDTLVAVPDGGTIFVAVPKSGKKGGPSLLFAFTARSA